MGGSLEQHDIRSPLEQFGLLSHDDTVLLTLMKLVAKNADSAVWASFSETLSQVACIRAPIKNQVTLSGMKNKW